MKIDKNYYSEITKEYEEILKISYNLQEHMLKLKNSINKNITEASINNFITENINNNENIEEHLKIQELLNNIEIEIIHNIDNVRDNIDIICRSEPIGKLLELKYKELEDKYNNTIIGLNISNFLFDLPTYFSDFNSIEAIEKELKKIINKGNS